MKDKFNRISDYALIGNCRTAALISKQGSIDWCCFPKFDSPSYFARLLDPAGGHFSITPVGRFDSKQDYLEGTNILQTTFINTTGSAVLTDLFSVKDREHHSHELWPDEEILRFIEVQTGEVEFLLEFLPRTLYGQKGMLLKRIGDWGIKGVDGRKHLLLQSSLQAEIVLENTPLGLAAKAKFKVLAGKMETISLTYSDEAPAVMPPLQTALERRNHTLSYWRGWSTSALIEGPYGRLIQRSALMLKLLNYAPSGAFVAAPTTSLPEWIGGSRNWDYRFCWLRDASFTTRALLRLGYLDEAKAFLNWLLHSTRLTRPRLQVLYTVYGESKVPECIAHWLSGFRGSKPVRIGNYASSQVQIDVYGEVIDSLYALADHLHPIDRETQEMVIDFGKTVVELWDQPDHGIWEFRTMPKHHTHSKVMCWVAMDRLAKLAERFNWHLPFQARTLCRHIRTEIEKRGFHRELNYYTRAFGETELDASLLVMPLVGFCEATDPRYVSTRDAIIQNLGRKGVIYRYPPGSDGMSEPEGAFILCNFWLAEAFARAGDLSSAERWFSAVAGCLPISGLSSEEVDPDSREYLGNHPQGFSHIGLINAALAIEELQNRESKGGRLAA